MCIYVKCKYAIRFMYNRELPFQLSANLHCFINHCEKNIDYCFNFVFIWKGYQLVWNHYVQVVVRDIVNHWYKRNLNKLADKNIMFLMGYMFSMVHVPLSYHIFMTVNIDELNITICKYIHNHLRYYYKYHHQHT